MAEVQVHEVLQEQLKEARKTGDDVQAIFRLRPKTPGKRADSPQVVRERAEALIKSACEAAKIEVAISNIFENFGLFLVVAKVEVIDEFCKRGDEITSAGPNRGLGSPVMGTPTRKLDC